MQDALLDIRIISDIQLQDLALHFDCANQYPNLFGSELARIGPCQVFQFLGHCRMLVCRRLQAQAHVIPGVGQDIFVIEICQIINSVRQKQANSRDIPRCGTGLQVFDSISKFLAIHLAPSTGQLL